MPQVRILCQDSRGPLSHTRDITLYAAEGPLSKLLAVLLQELDKRMELHAEALTNELVVSLAACYNSVTEEERQLEEEGSVSLLDDAPCHGREAWLHFRMCKVQYRLPVKVPVHLGHEFRGQMCPPLT